MHCADLENPLRAAAPRQGVQQGTGVRIDQGQALGAAFTIDQREPIVRLAAQRGQVVQHRLRRDVTPCDRLFRECGGPVQDDGQGGPRRLIDQRIHQKPLAVSRDGVVGFGYG